MLTQLATVKDRLGILPADTQYDAMLTRCIQAVSGRFDRECGRRFARNASATHEFPGRAREIMPECYPVESVARFELKETEVDGWVERTGVEYLLRSWCVVSLGSALSSVEYSVGRITYSGGYVLPGTTPGGGQTGLPADLEFAASEQVASWFYNKEKIGLIRHWPNTGTYVVLSQQPLLPMVGATLKRYQRWRV